jgi:hypothetical protein
MDALGLTRGKAEAAVAAARKHLGIAGRGQRSEAAA